MKVLDRWGKLWSSSWDPDDHQNEWATPRWLVDKVNTKWPLGLDIASLWPSRCVNSYLGPDHEDTRRRDALAMPVGTWTKLAACETLLTDQGPRACWCNPPYGRGMRKWLQRLNQEGEHGTVIVLIYARVDTKWWWRDVLGRDADGKRIEGVNCAKSITWLEGRLSFLDPSTWKPREDAKGRAQVAPAPSVIIEFAPGPMRDWPENLTLADW